MSIPTTTAERLQLLSYPWDVTKNDFVTDGSKVVESNATYFLRQNLILQLTNGIKPTMIICLVGQTRTGKTWLVQHMLERLGLLYQPLALQADNEDDTNGYPRFTPDSDQLKFMKPPWLHPGVQTGYFLDETDKSKNEVKSTLLTFLSDGRVRDWTIAEGSVIVVAMNELDEGNELDDAFKARLCFIRFEPTFRDSDFKPLVLKLADICKWNSVVLPEQVTSPEAPIFLSKVIKQCADRFFNNRSFQTDILYSMFHKDHVEMVREYVNALNIKIDYKELLKSKEGIKKYLDRFVNVVEDTSQSNPFDWKNRAAKLYQCFLNVKTKAETTHLYEYVEDLIKEDETLEQFNTLNEGMLAYLKAILNYQQEKMKNTEDAAELKKLEEETMANTIVSTNVASTFKGLYKVYTEALERYEKNLEKQKEAIDGSKDW